MSSYDETVEAFFKSFYARTSYGGLRDAQKRLKQIDQEQDLLNRGRQRYCAISKVKECT